MSAGLDTRPTDEMTASVLATSTPHLHHVHMAKTPMSDEHKAALAEGRRQGNAVRNYLDALESNRPKRGRKRTPESMRAKLQEIEATITDASGVRRLELLQQRRDLERELESGEQQVDISALEAEFVELAKGYSERKGIEYGTWREFGVPAPVLKAAGITRGS